MKFSPLSLAFLLLFGQPTTLPAAHLQRCGEGVLREGALPSPRGLRLGRPAEFDDGVGIQAGRCFPLYAGGRFVTWLNSYHRAGSRLYVRRCVEVKPRGATGASGRSGYVEDDFDELRFDARGGARFVKFEPPMWSEFSNPAFCGNHVAYWATESEENGRVRVHAVLFSLSGRKVLRREFVGEARVESDSRDFFPPPRWDAGARSATFDPPAADTSRSGARELKSTTLRLR